MTSWTQNVYEYFNNSLGFGWFFATIGALLWLTTVGLSFFLAWEQDGIYWAVLVFTFLTGVTVSIDFRGVKWITAVTVAFGSAALFISQSLWTDDRGDPLRAFLLAIQLAAVGIQIGAIANSNGRDKLTISGRG